MPLVSPGVEVKEIDLTTVIPSAASTTGAFVGRFPWGPINDKVLVGSEDDVVKNFLTPDLVGKAPGSSTTDTPKYSVDFLTLASFLAYSGAAYVSRAAGADAYNANATIIGAAGTNIQVKNVTDFQTKEAASGFATYFLLGRWAGNMGNSLGVSAVFNSDQFSGSALDTGGNTFEFSRTGATITRTAGTLDLTTIFNVGDYVQFSYGTPTSITYKNQVTAVSATVLTFSRVAMSGPITSGNVTVTSVKRIWRFASKFSGAPFDGTGGNPSQMHLVIYDADGNWTGVAGSVIESYRNLDLTNTAALYEDGTPSYYRTVLNNGSAVVWAGALSVTANTSLLKPLTFTMTGGANGTSATTADLLTAWSVFTNPDAVDVSLLICGPNYADSSFVVENYVINNIAEARKDCVAFVSPQQASVVNAGGNELTNAINDRNALPSTSYAFMDSGWKYMFDKYSNTYRWVPLNGDIAGLTARVENERDAWYPPAGFNYGNIKNVVQLAWNPSQAQRDDLYSKNINPVVDFDGVGTVLFGDKTLLAKSSAFDRINVRRLFIILEKAIAKASKFSLFELNDEFTRARFVALVEPFLREIQGRRGITDFQVVCDETNNTPQVVDTNRFIGDIYIKPARSINFITLNFVAVPTGVDFNTVIGSF